MLLLKVCRKTLYKERERINNKFSFSWVVLARKSNFHRTPPSSKARVYVRFVVSPETVISDSHWMPLFVTKTVSSVHLYGGEEMLTCRRWVFAARLPMHVCPPRIYRFVGSSCPRSSVGVRTRRIPAHVFCLCA